MYKSNYNAKFLYLSMEKMQIRRVGVSVCDCIKKITDKSEKDFMETKEDKEKFLYVLASKGTIVEVNFTSKYGANKLRYKSMKTNVPHKFCPFCGEKYSE